MKSKFLLLTEGVDKLGLKMPKDKLLLFKEYLGLLREWGNKFNLTAISDESEVLVKHFVDSLACATAFPVGRALSGLRIIDIGSGAGFPGIPIKILEPSVNLTLLEASRKKGQFLKEVCQRLGLENVGTVHARAEALAHDAAHRESYDVVLARAVAPLIVLVEYSLGFLSKGGLLIAQKGPQAEQELRAAGKAIETLGGRVREVRTYKLEGLGVPLTRNLVVISKVGQTPARYPRRSGIPLKRPIK
ncbi:MAG: 16S rRNA (guanine(527)-N(7))-methyltransferase RsmG [bacterium]